MGHNGKKISVQTFHGLGRTLIFEDELKEEYILLERRRNPRVNVSLHLSISDLYRQNPALADLKDLDSPIQIIDISLSGIAFITECVLPIGYFFDAALDTPAHKNKVFTGVKIIRSDTLDHTRYLYGCEFTHQPENLQTFLAEITKTSSE